MGVVVAAMRSFPFRRELQFQGCRALYFLGPIFVFPISCIIHPIIINAIQEEILTFE